MTIDDLVLTDPQAFMKGYPYALWKKLRDEDPVHWTQGRTGKNFWSVTRHADVRTVLADGNLYSSEEDGVSLPTSNEFMDTKKSEHARLVKERAMLPVMDGERHAKLRAPFVSHFSPKTIASLEPLVAKTVSGIMAGIPDSQETDFVTQVAARLPSSMIFALMDIPQQDWKLMFDCTNMYTAPSDPEFARGTVAETREYGASTTIGYCRDLGAKRRNEPGNDILSFIANIEIDGKKLSPDEVGFLGHMLIVGGQETTRNSLSAGLFQLLQEPEKLIGLRANPALLTTLPDEFVRWASPIAHLMRTATADAELGGKQIRKGDWVVAWMASANRDERAFTNPDAFDLARKPNPHLSFGFGPHFCVGAALGRMMIRHMMSALLANFATIEICGDPEYVASVQFFGMKHLPVRFTRKHQLAA